MERTAKAILLCLLVAMLIESSTGFYRRTRRSRKCRGGILRIFSRRRRCRRPVTIAMMPTTDEPPTKATPRPVVVMKPIALHSSGLPYCKSSRDINEILRPTTGRTKREVSWPYECRHASILLYLGSYQFIWPIYDCCTKCRIPAFANCVADTENPPDWLCPSKGLHCIVDCVNKNNPAGNTIGAVQPPPKPGISTSGLRPGIVNPGTVNPRLSKCEKLEVENGKKCVRQLCVPLNFKP